MYLIEFSDMLLKTFYATFVALEILTFLEDVNIKEEMVFIGD